VRVSSCGGKPLLPILFPPERLAEQGFTEFPVPPPMSIQEHAGMQWTTDNPLEAALASLTVDGSYLVASAAPQAPPVPDNFIVPEQARVNGEEQCELGNRVIVPRRLTKKTIVSPSLTSSASAPALISIPTPPELPVSLACDPRGVDVLPRKRVRRVGNLVFHE